MKGIEIVLLVPADLARLCAVRPGLFDEDIREGEAAAFLADPMNICVLAYDGTEAVGMVTGTILRHPDKAPSLFVNELGTRDEWVRQGIATALMDRIRAEARARGCDGAWLGTELDNEVAQSFYRSLGAEELPGVFYGFDGVFADEAEPDDDGAS